MDDIIIIIIIIIILRSVYHKSINKSFIKFFVLLSKLSTQFGELGEFTLLQINTGQTEKLLQNQTDYYKRKMKNIKNEKSS